MSWEGMLLLWRDPRQRNKKAEVALGKLREVVFLKWYMRPGDEKLAPEEFGRRIDDGLVEAIGRLLPIEHGDNGIEEFKSRVRQIEEGMRENIALKAFAATLRENSKGPLASETYLQLARRHALYGGNLPLPLNKVVDLPVFYWLHSWRNHLGSSTGTAESSPKSVHWIGWVAATLTGSESSSVTPK